MPGAVLTKAVFHNRGPRQQGLAILGLAVQDPERVGLQAAPAVITPAFLFTQIKLQLGLKIAGALGQPRELMTRRRSGRPNFPRRSRSRRMTSASNSGASLPEGLAVYLVELAVTPLLGPFVLEHGAHERVLFDPGAFHQAVFQAGPNHLGGGLGPQGQAIAPAVGEGVHLLGHDIRVGAELRAKARSVPAKGAGSPGNHTDRRSPAPQPPPTATSGLGGQDVFHTANGVNHSNCSNTGNLILKIG